VILILSFIKTQVEKQGYYWNCAVKNTRELKLQECFSGWAKEHITLHETCRTSASHIEFAGIPFSIIGLVECIKEGSDGPAFAQIPRRTCWRSFVFLIRWQKKLFFLQIMFWTGIVVSFPGIVAFYLNRADVPGITAVEVWFPVPIIVYAFLCANDNAEFSAAKQRGNAATAGYWAFQWAWRLVADFFMSVFYLIGFGFYLIGVTIPFFPAYIRFAEGGEFGSETHFGKFIVACAFLSWYGGLGVFAWQHRMKTRTLGSIKRDLGMFHERSSQIRTLGDLNRWKDSIVSIQADIYLCSRRFQASAGERPGAFFLIVLWVVVILKIVLVRVAFKIHDLHEAFSQASIHALRMTQMQLITHSATVQDDGTSATTSHLAMHVGHVISYLDLGKVEFKIHGISPTKRSVKAMSVVLAAMSLGIITHVAASFISEDVLLQIQGHFLRAMQIKGHFLRAIAG
jgi:hypothetical protein